MLIIDLQEDFQNRFHDTFMILGPEVIFLIQQGLVHLGIQGVFLTVDINKDIIFLKIV